MTCLVVVRPEPGNSATANAARARGHDVLQVPLFTVVPLPWRVPPPRDYDALIVTSANAIRHGGEGLATLKGLLVVAVGPASAAAARAAGFAIAATGSSNAAAAGALAAAHGFARVLHLGGRERVAIAGADAVSVYASTPVAIPDDLATLCRDRIVLLHSARAAARLAELVDPGERGRVGIAGISAAVVAAAGSGWRSAAVAASPTGPALLDTISNTAAND